VTDPGQDFVLAQLNRPTGLDVVFIASVTKNKSHEWKYKFGAFSVSKGTSVSNYTFPALPRDFRGIVWSDAIQDRLTVMSFYGEGGNWRNAFCTFPKVGGACEKWIPLATDNEVAFTVSVLDGPALFLMLGFSNESQMARLVRSSDGQELWSGKLLRPNIVPPLAFDGGVWRLRNPDAWRSVSRDVALGGDTRIFEMVTRLNARDLDVKAIDDISGQNPETFTRTTPFRLVKSKLKSFVGSVLKQMGFRRGLP